MIMIVPKTLAMFCWGSTLPTKKTLAKIPPYLIASGVTIVVYKLALLFPLIVSWIGDFG